MSKMEGGGNFGDFTKQNQENPPPLLRARAVADVNDILPVNFHQVEDWHDLIVRIVNEIKHAL